MSFEKITEKLRTIRRQADRFQEVLAPIPTNTDALQLSTGGRDPRTCLTASVGATIPTRAIPQEEIFLHRVADTALGSSGEVGRAGQVIGIQGGVDLGHPVRCRIEMTPDPLNRGRVGSRPVQIRISEHALKLHMFRSTENGDRSTETHTVKDEEVERDLEELQPLVVRSDAIRTVRARCPSRRDRTRWVAGRRAAAAARTTSAPNVVLE